ncbi:MAG: PAS domain S-box protein [Actinomycetota bacterium]|nr:PAS domain S-box protein [Actinomycetota bacterium]
MLNSALREVGGHVRQALPRGRTLPQDVWKRRHRAMLAILWLHAPGLAIFGIVQNFGVGHSLIEAGIVAVIALASSLPLRTRKVPAALVSFGLLTSSAILVHMSGGFIEAHFHFFVMIVLLSLYEDWTPFLLAVAYVVVHHGVFGALDPRSVYNHASAIAEPWKWATIHGLFIAGAGLVSIAAWKLNEGFRAKFRDIAAIVESSQDAILTKTLEGIITTWNAGATKMYGYAPDEIIGRSIRTLVPADRKAEIDDILERVRAGKTVKSFETVRLAKDGRRLDVSVTISPVRDQEGRVVGASTIARDITRRKRAEVERERFFTVAMDMLCVAGFDGNFKRVNPAWERVLGWSETELRSRPFLWFVHPDDVDRTRTEARKLIEGETTIHFQNRYRHRDGTYRWLDWTAVPDVDYQLTYASARDVTRSKELEDALHRYASEVDAANRKLEESNQTLKDFVAIASHDLRGPLSTILGLASGMPRTWDSTDDTQKREFIAAIERAARRIARLVEDLLTVSRIEAGKVSVHKQTVNLPDAVQEAIRRSETVGDGVRTDIPRASVEVDPDHLERILTNYVTNALKYGEHPVEVEAREKGEWVEIHVRDWGPGVPPDFVPRMWEKFSRPEDASQRHTGTGLGLSIVAGLARANGGTAWYEPNNPRGSCFCLRLPKPKDDHLTEGLSA